jgi:hypothetical protein
MTNARQYEYTEHVHEEVAGFSVVDATSTGPRPHDDRVWVGYGNEGKWLTFEEAIELSTAIRKTAVHNAERREKNQPNSLDNNRTYTAKGTKRPRQMELEAVDDTTPTKQQ